MSTVRRKSPVGERALIHRVSTSSVFAPQPGAPRRSLQRVLAGVSATGDVAAAMDRTADMLLGLGHTMQAERLSALAAEIRAETGGAT